MVQTAVATKLIMATVLLREKVIESNTLKMIDHNTLAQGKETPPDD